MNDTQHYVIELDDNRFQETSSRVKRSFGAMGDTAEAQGERIDNSFRKMAVAAAGFFTLKQAADFARQMIKVRAEVESLEISFRTLVGNKEKADALFASIRDFAVNTPMMLNGLAKGAQTLLSFNVEADKVMGILKQIGDISMGNQQRFDSLTLAFAQMSATGKLMGQDLLQMINAGFNPLSVMSEKTGKSIAQLKDEMSAGAITSEMVAQAFADATSEGGKFYNMLEKQSKGLNGSISNLKGAIDDMFNDIGTKSQGTVSDIIQGATTIVRNYQKIGDALTVLIATYGSYKAAVIATNLVMKASAFVDNIRLIGMFRKELGLLKAAQQAFNLTAMQNPYILLASAIIGACVAIGKLVKRQREEEQAVIDSTREMREEYTQTNKLVTKLKDANLKEGERKKILDQLREVNPDIVQGIKDEATAYEQLNARLEEYNKRQLAAIAVKQFSKREDFDESVEDLVKAKDKMESANADMINTWSTIYSRYLEMRDENKNTYHSWEGINPQVASLIESLAASDASEAEKVEAVFSALRKRNKEKQDAHGATIANEWEWGELNNLMRGLSDSDFKSAADKLDKLSNVYEDKANALKAKIEQIAASIYTTDEKARQEFIDSQMALYFPDTVKKPEDNGGEQPVIKNIKEQTAEARALVKQLEQEIADLRSGKTTTDANGNEIKDFAAEIAAREKALKEAKERLATLTGETDKGTKNNAGEAERMRRQVEKDGQALVRLKEDLALEALEAEYETWDEGFAKQEKLRELAHQREMLQLQRNREDYLAKLQDAERAQWEADNPNWKEKNLTFTPTITALPADIKANFDAIEKYMTDSFNKANKKSLEEALSDILTYEQKRAKIIADYEANRSQFYTHDSEGNETGLREGVTEGNLEELQSQRDAALASLDEEVASRSQSYQSWLNQISTLTVSQLKTLLEAAKKALYTLEHDPTADPAALAEARAKVVQLEQTIRDSNLSPDIEELVKWQLYSEQLDEAGKALSSLGDQMGGVAGEALSMLGTIMTSTSTMVKNIQQITENCLKAMEDGATKASKAIAAAQSAVAILAIIQAIYSAVCQLRDLIDNNFDTDSGFGKFASDFLHFLTDSETMLENLAWSLLGPVGTLVGMLNSTNKASDRRAHQQEIERLMNTYDELNYQVSRLGKQAEETFGETNAAIRQQQIELKKLQIEALRSAIAEERELKDPDEDKIAGWESQIQTLQDDIEDLETAAVDAIYGESIKTAIENFADALVDAWSNGTSASEAANKYIRDMIKKTALQAILDYTQASARIDAIRDKIKQYLDNDGIISESEQSEIEGMAQQLMDEVTEQFEWAQHLFEEEREGSKKGIAQASQESVDELNGRATAIQGHTYSIAENTQQLLATANAILNSVLVIRDNTDSLGAKVDTMNEQIRVMRNDISDITTKGIIIKR